MSGMRSDDMTRVTAHAPPARLKRPLRGGARQPGQRRIVGFSAKDKLAFFQRTGALEHKDEEAFHLLLRDWFDDVTEETDSFSSPFIAAQVKLAEASKMTEALPTPNEFMTALSCNTLGSLAAAFGRFSGIVGTVHELLHECTYAPNSDKPYFAKVCELEEGIENLRHQRHEFIVKQRRLKQEQEDQRELFDSTVARLQRGIIKRTFQAWRGHVEHNKKYTKRLQIVFSKWWRGEDLLRWHFGQWQVFREKSVRSRLDQDLEQGSMDLVYHEKLAIEKQRILDTKLAEAKAMEAEFLKRAKLIENERKVLQAAQLELHEVAESSKSLEQLASKLAKFSESLGHNVLKAITAMLQQLVRTPDASVLLSRSKAGAGEGQDPDVLLHWLKLILAKVYERDADKRLLLSGARTLAKVVELGLGIDLVQAVPAPVREAAVNVSDQDILLEFVDLESYNADHVKVVTELAKCHVVVSKDASRSAAQEPASKPPPRLTARRGTFRSPSRRSVDSEERGAGEAPDEQKGPTQSPTGRLRPDRRVSYLLPAASDSSNTCKAEERASLNGQSSPNQQLQQEQHHVQGQQGQQGQGPPKLVHQDTLFTSALEELREKNAFFDEDMPLVGVEELLDALEPQGEHTSLFLSTFLRTFLLSEPLIDPVLREDAEVFQQLANFRNESAKLIDLACPPSREQAGGGTGAQHRHLVSVDRIQARVDAAEQAHNRWRVVTQTCAATTGAFSQNTSWDTLRSDVELALWRSLSLAGTDQVVAQADSQPTQHHVVLKDLQGHYNQLTLSRHELAEALHNVMQARYKDMLGTGAVDAEDEDYNPIGYLEKAIENELLVSLDVLSLALKRYALCGSVIDMLKESGLLEQDKFSSKKLRPKLAELLPEPGDKLKLEHILDALLFVAERNHKGSIDESFAETLRSSVLSKLAASEALLNKDIYLFQKEQLQSLRAVFANLRTKASPVAQVSQANWRNALEHHKALVDKVHLTKQALLDIFARSCSFSSVGGSESISAPQGKYHSLKGKQGVQALCFSEFSSAILKIAFIKFPCPFQSADDKISATVQLLGKPTKP